MKAIIVALLGGFLATSALNAAPLHISVDDGEKTLVQTVKAEGGKKAGKGKKGKNPAIQALKAKYKPQFQAAKGDPAKMNAVKAAFKAEAQALRSKMKAQRMAMKGQKGKKGKKGKKKPAAE